MSRPRVYGLLSVLALGAYAVALLAASRTSGQAFETLSPWPLGGGPSAVADAGKAASLALGLGLGWGVPGLALALLTNGHLRGAILLGRAFGLGLGYILVTGLLHAAVLGHAPGRLTLLVLLALPPFALLWRSPTAERPPRDRALPAAVVCMTVLAFVLWPKLHREGLNGDGTEAYELARSLDAHALPYWDLEQLGTGRFGTPAVNPFLTNSYLVAAEMALLGRSELSARLPLIGAAVLCGVLAVGLIPGASLSAVLYIAGVTSLHLLWNCYYVGYEPAFTDLAEPAATDLLMVALLLAGASEMVQGTRALGVLFFLLASGILYSAPILATVFLVGMAAVGLPGMRPTLALWTAGLAAAAIGAVAYGVSHGLVETWLYRFHDEYWYDLAGTFRRTSSLGTLGHLLLLTGGLPVLAVWRWRDASPVMRVLLLTAGVYGLIVLAHGYKNLHYLAPLPYLLAPPAAAAAGPRLRVLALAVVGVAFALSWPDQTQIHREAIELGDLSCIEGLSYEQASIAGGALYKAFAAPSEETRRFSVGKHTFVRYALDRGGEDGCVFRLSAAPRADWLPVVHEAAVFSVRDLDLYAAWRLRPVSIPSSWLFPRAQGAAVSSSPQGWSGAYDLAVDPGAALLIEGESPRLLIPGLSGGQVRLHLEAPPPSALVLRVNGHEAMRLTPSTDYTIAREGPLWRSGWNLLELGPPSVAIRKMDFVNVPR